MGIKDTVVQRVRWQCAELTPGYEQRQRRRAAYDERYGVCGHGTHLAAECPGDDDTAESGKGDE